MADPLLVPGNDDGHLASSDCEHRGQVLMAYRFAETYRSRLMFVRGVGWYVWDGRRWDVDERDAATRAVLDVLRRALSQSLYDKELRSDVRRCESSTGVTGVLRIASALPGIRAAVADLDADPFLLNCANGTLDLRTRRLRRHDPNDRLTRVTRGAYDLNADTTTWHSFLSDILPDGEVRRYLQRVVGQSVYGRVREHLFPILTGSGSNGKGTAYGAVTNALGDYAAIINPELLMRSERGNGGPEMMALRGARLVIGSETEEGRQLDAALMKRLTGGDELTARRLYQEPVSWVPTHQLLYVTNHLPKVKGNDPAVWRRIRVLPFNVVVSRDMRDPTLPERLELVADSILSWSVQGWYGYQDGKDGMNEPESVLRATDEYQTASDAVKRFIQSECMRSPSAVASTRSLYQSWANWVLDNDVHPLKEAAFAKELDRLGYVARRTASGMIRKGLKLNSSADV